MKIKMGKTLLFGGNRFSCGETVETDDATGKLIVKAGFAVEETAPEAAETPAETPAEEKAAETPAETPAEEKAPEAAETPAKGKKAAKK